MLCGGSCATAKALRAAAAQEQIQGFCCGCLAGSLRAAHQEQEGAQDSRGCAGTCPGHLCRARGSSGLAVTGTPGWSGGPPSSNGVCCPQSLCLPWNPGGKNKCGKWGTRKEPVVCKKKKRNNGSPQSALLLQWFAGCMGSFCSTGRAHLYSPPFHQSFTAPGLGSCWSSHRY